MTDEERWDRGWEKARILFGAPDYAEGSLSTRRSDIHDLKSGDRVLFLRKYAGLGDCLIQSCLFDDLRKQIPSGVEICYAIPRSFHCLFRGFPTIHTYGEFRSYRSEPQVLDRILDEFALVEDLSVPEVHWERIFSTNGYGDKMHWLNRLEMWAWWIGMNILDAKSCIRIYEDDVELARSHHNLEDPYIAVSVKTLHEAKDYPYYVELSKKISDLGFLPLFLHSKPMVGVESVVASDVREMGAIIKGARAVVSCDTAAMHWAGILDVPCVALFSCNDSEAYIRYYDSIVPIQFCDTPCILKGWDMCEKRVETRLGHDGRSCYENRNDHIISSLEEIIDVAALSRVG